MTTVPRQFEGEAGRGRHRPAEPSFVVLPAPVPKRPTFRHNLAELTHNQKPGGGVPAYMRWVNRRAARGIAAAAAALGMTPNQVTAISAGLSVIGLAVLVVSPVSWATGVLVALLLALGFAFDSADGQLARLTGVSGPAGEWLDHVVDGIRSPAVHLCVAAAVMLHQVDQVRWVIPIAACFAVLAVGQFTSQILAEQLVRNRGGEAPEASGVRKSFVLLPTDTGVLCWAFVLWGQPVWFAWAYAVLFALNVLHAAASMRRKYRKLVELSGS